MPTYNDSKNIEDREIDLLRNAVDKIESRSGKKVAQSPEVKKIIGCVERFLREKNSFVTEELQLIRFFLKSIDFIIMILKFQITIFIHLMH